MSLTVRQILSLIDSDIAPWHLAESWDNCGMCAGNPEWPVRRVLVGLDADMPVLEAARDWNADLVFTHHPLFISPVKTIDFSVMPGSAIALSAQEKLAIVCAHTNLDKAENGLNDELARRLEIRPDRVLEIDPGAGEMSGNPAHPDQQTRPSGHLTGMGRIGQVPAPVSLAQMVDQVKAQLGGGPVRMVGDPSRKIREAAVCSGSGGSLIPAFLASGADVFITGDIKYHEARLIETQGRALIDVGHFASEIIAKDLLCRRLEQSVSRAGFSLEIKAFTGETDPFVTV